MSFGMVGRDVVIEEAGRALAARSAVLLEGPAGIGKTTVWRELVAEAGRSGSMVLACAPTEGEASLPFAALADLLRPLADRIRLLPPPQRVAAEVVLLAAYPDDAVDERAIAAATRSLLENAMESCDAVLVAIDDAPWLDPHSERALRFALRRLAPRPGVLVARRAEGLGPLEPPLGLDGDGPIGHVPASHVPASHRPAGHRPAGRLTRIGLTPLGAGALHHVIRANLGQTLSRPLLTRVAREAGGNPLMAIELARAVLRLPHPPGSGDDLPVASSIQQLLTDALRVLPTKTRDAVRLASLLTVPTLEDLATAGVTASAFDPAEEAGLLVVTATGVAFAHPLYATAVRANIPPGVRRRLQQTLAAAATDPDERARQLAQSTAYPDAAISGLLEEAAARHRRRGAPAAAAELYEQAADLTPSDATAEHNRRRLAALRCRFDSGDYATAGAAAEQAATVLTGAARAEALLLRATVAWAADDMGMALSSAQRGLAAAEPASRLAGRIHAHLSLFNDDPGPARWHAQAAIELLSTSDLDLRCSSLLQLFFHEVRAGLPARTELVERALELEGGAPSWLSGTIPAIWWRAIDDHDRARTRLHDMLEHAVTRGDEPWQHELLTHLGETELVAGRFDIADTHIAAARELGQQLGTGLVGETWLAGMLAAYRGHLAEARSVAEAGLRRAEEFDDAWCRRIHLQLAGLVALSQGRAADAATAYRSLVATLGGSGVVEPIAQRFEPDWIEACVTAGDLDTAAVALARLADRHTRLPRPWTTLGLARSRVLLASAAGTDPIAELVELAQARHGVPAQILPLDRARCLLVAGLAHRRARRKREARETLAQACTEFAAIGAQAFAERARTELSRVGGRPAISTGLNPTALTPTEKRVAAMAAAGHTNRAIADALFISAKTVEANLGRVYRKLGIVNRAQLGAALASTGDGSLP